MKAGAKKSSTTTPSTATQAANEPFFAPVTGTAAPSVPEEQVQKQKTEEVMDRVVGMSYSNPPENDPNTTGLRMPENGDTAASSNFTTAQAAQSATPSSSQDPGTEASSSELSISSESEYFPLTDTEELEPLLTSESESDDNKSIENDTEQANDQADQQQGEGEAEEATESDVEGMEKEELSTEGQEAGAEAEAAEGPSDGAAEAAGPAAGNESLGELQTGELVLIDMELAEHQRWGSSLERVGTTESLERAEFVAEAAGGGILGGLASGAAMGMGMGLVGRAASRFIPIPGVGGVLSGAVSVYGLASRDWSASGAAIGQFGEGASTYETLANSIAAIAEIVDIVSNVLGVVEGVVGVIQIGVYAVTAAAAVATIVTLGAAAPLLASMATLAETLTAISVALGVATTALDLINAGILQPAVLLFRALHAFTSEADPREVETQGSELTQAASAIGGAVGGAVGARGAAAGGRPRGGGAEAPNARPHAEAPVPAATGDGPTVRVETPRIDADAAPTSASRPTVDPIATTEHPASVAQSSSTRSNDTLEPIVPMPIIPVGDTPAVSSSVGGSSASGPVGGTPVPPSSGSNSGGGGQITSDTSFRLPANPDVGPVTVHPDGSITGSMPDVGLQRHDIRHRSDPNKINYHENMEFRGVTRMETTDTGGSTTSIPVPVRPANSGSQAGQPWPMQLRAHSENPGVPDPLAHSRNNPTAQANTSRGAQEYLDSDGNWQSTGSPDFGPDQLASNPNALTARGQGQLYFNPETGTFVPTRAEGPTPGTTVPHPDIGPAHMPIGGRDRGQTGLGEVPEIPAGVPSPGAPTVGVATPPTTSSPGPTLWSERPEPEGMVHTSLGQPGVNTLPDFDPDIDLAFFDQYSHQGPSTPTPDSSGGSSGPSGGPTRPPITPMPIIPIGDAAVTSSSQSTSSQQHFPVTSETPTAPVTTTQAVNTSQLQSTLPSASNTPLTVTTSGSVSPSMSPLRSYNIATRVNRMGQGVQENEEVQQTPPGVASQVGQLFLPQLFGPSGEAPTQQQREDSHRARFADDAQTGDTIVERVNPDYPPPPGTPQQLQAIQQEIENLFAARAQAERAEAAMTSQEQVLKADQAPIQQAIDGAGGGISAVQAHQEAVTRRGQVNQEQQQRQQETGGLVAGYPSRATGLATLSVPLDIFAGFTSLASHLPGDAGAAMAEMNQDARQIQDAFAQMAIAMVTQEEAQPDRQAELIGQQSRIEATDAGATASSQSVEQSQRDALSLQQENETQLIGARQARAEASEHEQTLDEAATIKQAQADTLAEQLKTWAQQHKEARRQAVEATAKQLEAEGYVVLEKNEG